MLLHDMSWRQFAASADSYAILPVGAVEPHGPHLPLGSDTIISDYFARELAQATGGFVTPTIGYGVATPPQRLGGAFPGVISISGTTFTALVTEVLHSLASEGTRRFVIVNSAIDNISFLCEAARALTETHGGAQVMIVNWWDVIGEEFRNRVAAETGISRTVDHHAGMMESSLVMYLAPGKTRQPPESCETLPRRFSYHIYPLPPDTATRDGIVYTAGKASAAIGARAATHTAHMMAIAVRTEFGSVNEKDDHQ